MPTPQAAVLTDDRSMRRDSPAEVLAQGLSRQTQEQFPVKAQVSIPSDKRDAFILATVQASSDTRGHATTHRRALQAQAHHLTSFEHFRRLCLADIHMAYHADRQASSRRLKYRRLAWLALFRYYARHRGINQTLTLAALDRQGNYTCTLTDKKTQSAATPDWRKLVRLARPFGITEHELTLLWKNKQAGAA